MPDYFSRDATETPFKHPLTNLLKDRSAIRPIYAEKNVGSTQIFEEWEARGDPVGRPATELIRRCNEKEYQPTTWSVRLSTHDGNWVMVVGPKDFEINQFQHDLTLLLSLGVIGQLTGRRSYLYEFENYARLLSGSQNWGEQQGWWHRDANVIVVCGAADDNLVLSDALIDQLNIKREKIIEIDTEFGLVERIFEEATTIFFEETRKHPR